MTDDTPRLAQGQDLERIADVIEPHWRGAGLKLTADWIIEQFIKLGDTAALAPGNGAEEAFPKVQLQARRTINEQWIDIFPAQVEWMSNAHYMLRAIERKFAAPLPATQGDGE